jgi:class 3 adenylate cyclase
MERSETIALEGCDAEARHATVLKCDLVGSTQIKRRLDIEGQLIFQRGFEQFVTAVATRHGAHIERFEGDGALIVFGFPQSREDAAESAVRMGVEFVDTIPDAEIIPAVRLQLRVGVASGLIAVVRRPSSPRGELIGGLTIDLAERLKALANPGQVVIEGATKRLAAGFFRYTDLGSVQLKGFDEAVRAWRVVNASGVISRFEAQRLDESQREIVGRVDVLSRLSEAWMSSLSGHGRAVCLVGEAGIGKSRLARAAFDAAVRDSAATLSIDCTPSTSNTPLFPIGVMLRRTANITPASSEEEKRTLAEHLLAQLLPNDDVPAALICLAPLFGLESVSIPTGIGPAELRKQTILTVVRLLSNFAAERPLAVLCEDVHWVDDTTATVLARLREETERLRALIIVTMRPMSDEPPLELSKFITISLQPLDPSTAADFIRSVDTGAALPDEIVRRIVDRCEGVPLVLEEVTRNALEVMSRPDGAGTVARSDGEIPAPLQLVIQSRLSRVPRLVPIVQLASVIGREFSMSLLEKMVSVDQEPALADAIELLAREGLFFLPDSHLYDRVRFKHIMICEAVYNTLLSSDRKRLHSEVADILSHEYKGTPDAAPDVIAQHLLKATRFGEAIRLRIAATGDTAARGAFVETKGHCVAALALLDEVKDPEERTILHFQLLLQHGIALTGEHGYSAAVVEDTYRRAQGVCGHSAEAEKLYPIMRSLATVNLDRGNLATAYDLSLQGLKLAEQSKRVEFRIDAMSVLCYTTFYFGQYKECRGWVERCLQLYHAERGDRLAYPVPQDAGTAAIGLLTTVAWLQGDSHGAEDAVRDGFTHVESLNREFDKAFMQVWIAGTRYTQRRYAEALEHAEIAVQISQKHSYRELHGIGTLLALLAKSALNADPQAVAQAAAVCMAFAEEGVGLLSSYYLWGLARGYANCGDAQTARQMVAQGFTRAAASGETRMNAELLILQAELDHDDASATKLLTSAVALAEEQGALATALRATAAIALRSPCDADGTEFARATLDMLDGRTVYPTQRDWMKQRLAALTPMLICGQWQ